MSKFESLSDLQFISVPAHYFKAIAKIIEKLLTHMDWLKNSWKCRIRGFVKPWSDQVKQKFILERNNLPKTRLIIDPPTLAAADDPTVALPPLLSRVYILDLLLFYLTDLPNKGADQKKLVRGKDFFFSFITLEICEYGGNFSHLLQEKLKVWWNLFTKKLSKHSYLSWSSEPEKFIAKIW